MACSQEKSRKRYDVCRLQNIEQNSTTSKLPLPFIDDILSLLGTARYFTALDLKSGYWQVQLDDDSKEKTAFACHRGLFQVNVMPFGLRNAKPYFNNS